MEEKKILGIERNVFFTGVTSFFTDTSTKMVYSIMPLFLLSIGASKTYISLIEGIAESTASLFKVFSGFRSDKTGKNKPLMIIGYGITALITPLYALTVTPVHVLLLRFFERTGKGIRAAPRDSLISGSVPPGEAGKSFGFHKAMDNSGAIIGPLIAFFFLSAFPLNYANIFMLAAIPAILGVVTIVLCIREAQSIKPPGAGKIRFRNLSGRYYFFLLIVFVFTLGNSTDALLLVKTTESGVKASYVPFIYMIYNAVSVFLAIPIGRLSDRIGREKLIIAGLSVYTITYFLFGKFNDVRIFILLFIMYGLYSALTDGSQKALISDLVKKELKGTGYGLYHAVLGIALLPANLIAGQLYDKAGTDAPFYFGSLMSFAALLLMIVFTLTNPGRKTAGTGK